MSTENTKKQAESALMDRLEDWAVALGDGGLTKSDDTRYYPTRTMPGMRKAYEAGKLLRHCTGWLAGYRYHPQEPSVQQMIRIKRAGLPVWEEIVAEEGQPWSPYVSELERTVLIGLVDRVTAEAERQVRSEAKLRAQMLARRGARARS